MSRSEAETVEIKVWMPCPCKGCEKKVAKSVKGMKGVVRVQVDGENNKLTVYVAGNVNPDDVLERVRRRTSWNADFWPKPQPHVAPKTPEASPQPHAEVSDDAPPNPEASLQSHAGLSDNAPPYPQVSPQSHAGLSDDAPQYPEALPQPHAGLSEDVDYYTTLFSHENPNSCTIM
ncbi:Heavy metal-associated isoprenylated plant protein 27, partial [Mucuna pruriens]